MPSKKVKASDALLATVLVVVIILLFNSGCACVRNVWAKIRGRPLEGPSPRYGGGVSTCPFAQSPSKVASFPTAPPPTPNTGTASAPDSSPVVQLGSSECSMCGGHARKCSNCGGCGNCRPEDKCACCERWPRQYGERGTVCPGCYSTPCACPTATGLPVIREPGVSRNGIFTDPLININFV